MNIIEKQVFELCGEEVTSTQVYNHLRKWRARWITLSKLKDITGDSWDQNTCLIFLEAEHYTSHVAVSSRPPCFKPVNHWLLATNNVVFHS